MVYLTYAMQCHRNWPPKTRPKGMVHVQDQRCETSSTFPFLSFRESILSVCMIWTPKAMEATGPDHHVVDLDFSGSQSPEDPLFPHRPLHPQTQRLYQYQTHLSPSIDHFYHKVTDLRSDQEAFSAAPYSTPSCRTAIYKLLYP